MKKQTPVPYCDIHSHKFGDGACEAVKIMNLSKD